MLGVTPWRLAETFRERVVVCAYRKRQWMASNEAVNNGSMMVNRLKPVLRLMHITHHD
jgi:hypothetical protein